MPAPLDRRSFIKAAAAAMALPLAHAYATPGTDKAPPMTKARTLDRSFATQLVPGDCAYRVAVPPDYDADRKAPYPLLLLLHGGGGSREFITGLLPALEDVWRSGQLEQCVAVCASAGRSFYMDYRDGSEAWETLLVTELLDAVRGEFNVSEERAQTAVSGVSMGGMGSLRLAFKHPHLFGTVAALEPGIEASLRYAELTPADTFYRQGMYVEKFGENGVVDAAYWERNNPATIAAHAPDALRPLAIYIEAGSEDGFELHRGTEFLHRVLWDNGVKHEYRHILGADHIGDSLDERLRYALAFIGRQWNPPPEDEAVTAFRKAIAPLRQSAGLPP